MFNIEVMGRYMYSLALQDLYRSTDRLNFVAILVRMVGIILIDYVRVRMDMFMA